jgi:hypothetical protein
VSRVRDRSICVGQSGTPRTRCAASARRGTFEKVYVDVATFREDSIAHAEVRSSLFQLMNRMHLQPVDTRYLTTPEASHTKGHCDQWQTVFIVRGAIDAQLDATVRKVFMLGYESAMFFEYYDTTEFQSRDARKAELVKGATELGVDPGFLESFASAPWLQSGALRARVVGRDRTAGS